jgi:hypothetical protein
MLTNNQIVISIKLTYLFRTFFFTVIEKVEVSCEDVNFELTSKM